MQSIELSAAREGEICKKNLKAHMKYTQMRIPANLEGCLGLGLGVYPVGCWGEGWQDFDGLEPGKT